MNSRLSFVLLSLGLSLAGCGGGAEGSPESGKAAVTKHECSNCHGMDLSGDTNPRPETMAYASNLTPDMDTGLGGWMDDQIIKAMRTGIDDEGEALCDPMPKFDISDQEAADIVAYLRTLPAVKKAIPESTCAGK
jgi:mono/diheme cytochrome c family protein